MIATVASFFTRGATYLVAHRQLFLSFSLVAVIPLAFLWSGQQFLNTASYNLERLENDRVGMLHDTFAALLSMPTTDESVLQTEMERITKQNPDVESFVVSAYVDGVLLPRIVVGKEHDANKYADMQRLAAVSANESIIFEQYDGTVRHRLGFRVVLDERGVPSYFIFTDTNMSALDAALRARVQSAYITLGFIILAVMVLLWRHVRLIDYARLFAELENAHKTMSLFVNMTAHELRTPLTAIRGYASMIHEDGTLPTTTRNDAGRIEESSTNLITLITDLLDLARLQSGKMSFSSESVDLIDILLKSVTLLQPIAKEHGIGLRTELGTGEHYKIRGDAARLSQAFTNIVSNALKYTKEGNVTVAISSNGKRHEVRIKDTGMGISAEDQKRLFAPYFRVSSEAMSTTSGTGLGMWITKRMIEEMKGTIDVESIKGVGTHIVVTFECIKV